jgi:pimeloyl-ACP methyl ester carboxylesterase
LPRFRRLLISLLVALAAFYGAVVLLVWLQQDRLVFAGAGRGIRALDAYGARELRLQGPAGRTFRAAEIVPKDPRALVLFFVGNGEDLCSAGRQAEELAAHGVAVLAPEHPGYGSSDGPTNVESMLGNAEAAAEHAAARARELGVPLVVGGSSIGTFCAVHVAASGRAARLLLRAPPTTMVDAAANRFWWLPVGLLLRHRFDNLTPAAAVRCPVLIVHGEADDIVPLGLGRRLAAAFAGAAEVVAVPGAGHNDLSLGVHGPVGGRVGDFLRGR